MKGWRGTGERGSKGITLGYPIAVKYAYYVLL